MWFYFSCVELQETQLRFSPAVRRGKYGDNPSEVDMILYDIKSFDQQVRCGAVQFSAVLGSCEVACEVKCSLIARYGWLELSLSTGVVAPDGARSLSLACRSCVAVWCIVYCVHFVVATGL